MKDGFMGLKTRVLAPNLNSRNTPSPIVKFSSVPVMSSQKDNFSNKSYPTIIDGTTRFKGDLELGANARIDGKFFGNLLAPGEKNEVTLVIGRDGDIQGDIRCHSIQISGTVHGNVRAKLVELRTGGVIEGDVEYDAIELHQGASILGALTCKAEGRKR